jgi:hypothetical protein
MRFFITVISALFITFNSAIAVDLMKLLPDSGDLHKVPNTKNGANNYDNDASTIRPAMTEVCAGKGILPPTTCTSNCPCQCMSNKNQTTVHWLQYCK